MHLPHPLGIPAGEIVVHGDHVHAAARESVEVTGQGGHKGFALTGFHLGDLPLVQHHAADHLHIEMTHAEHAFTGFAHHGERFRQQLIEQRSLLLQRPRLLQALAEIGGATA